VQQVDAEIRAIKDEIMKRCYHTCVEKLPTRIKAVFRAYYTDLVLEPRELIAERKRLANEVAGITELEAQSLTPEQELRILNNLQSKVNKWRKSLIEDCVKKCVAEQESRHSRLNYLSQQANRGGTN
jgi:chorismate mutase